MAYKAYIKIEYECVAETAEAAERSVLEECSYNIEIDEPDEEEEQQ